MTTKNSDQVVKGHRTSGVLRAIAWIGVSVIVILSVVPADERPTTSFGQGIEHFAAFGLIAGAFAVSYRFTLLQFLLMALLFCGGIELLQIPLPTRHARVSDFVTDLLGSSPLQFVLLFIVINSECTRTAERNSDTDCIDLTPATLYCQADLEPGAAGPTATASFPLVVATTCGP
jgi:hypothetical protein